jgi:hypothetical protein
VLSTEKSTWCFGFRTNIVAAGQRDKALRAATLTKNRARLVVQTSRCVAAKAENRSRPNGGFLFSI